MPKAETCEECGRKYFAMGLGVGCPHCSRVTPVMGRAETVTETVTAGDGESHYLSVRPLPGEPCPTCGRKMPKSHAQRQAAYRGRKA